MHGLSAAAHVTQTRLIRSRITRNPHFPAVQSSSRPAVQPPVRPPVRRSATGPAVRPAFQSSCSVQIREIDVKREGDYDSSQELEDSSRCQEQLPQPPSPVFPNALVAPQLGVQVRSPHVYYTLQLLGRMQVGTPACRPSSTAISLAGWAIRV
ncbi:hypothetical protein CONPUDRAFT_155190 [Coniophora puteana RWD-64-598 SS2]|uniref:Uncharacterized protein n=1 Tax=Coniophora puteana (strain RWD-64-598) TaxID=741705 RepID=A0A5M3ML55_CONPW|nr:uncharacterized protein CONPUDRAFT_155190 [Coniophora puteana RWD-64-598 SS2]EIW79796.1 hypothetical protein CONPUDRAFT_155190 [Coniophora puteana RWD-64-598 SS2]